MPRGVPAGVAISKSQQIVDHFAKHFLGREPLDVRDEIIRGLGGNIHPSIFYSMVRKMRAMNAAVPSKSGAEPAEAVDNGQPTDGFTIDFPSDLSDRAKEQFNRLMDFARQKADELKARELEMASLRSQLAQQGGRIRMLKKVGNDLMEAV